MALQSVIPDDITLLHKAYNLFVCAGGIVSVFSCRFVPGQKFLDIKSLCSTRNTCRKIHIHRFKSNFSFFDQPCTNLVC